MFIPDSVLKMISAEETIRSYLVSLLENVNTVRAYSCIKYSDKMRF